jgi:hypothetical protein
MDRISAASHDASGVARSAPSAPRPHLSNECPRPEIQHAAPKLRSGLKPALRLRQWGTQWRGRRLWMLQSPAQSDSQVLPFVQILLFPRSLGSSTTRVSQTTHIRGLFRLLDVGNCHYHHRGRPNDLSFVFLNTRRFCTLAPAKEFLAKLVATTKNVMPITNASDPGRSKPFDSHR